MNPAVVIRALYRRERQGPVITSTVTLPDTTLHTPVDLLEAHALRTLGIAVPNLHVPLTRQCAGTTAVRRPCKQFLDLSVPYCPQHLPLPARKTVATTSGGTMSLRVLHANPAFVAYARSTGMTVTQRWEADDYNTAAFDAWHVRARALFALDHPRSVQRGTHTITDVSTWVTWLSALRPDRMRQAGFV